jgi:hypothetical protein
MMQLSLSHQFAIAANQQLLPVHWPRRQLGHQHLAYASDLPCIEVRYPDDQLIGLLLGWPVTLSAVLLDEQTPFIVPQDSQGREFEQALYQLGGRWVCLSTTDNGRFYLDAMASQPCIVCPEAGLILSSAALLPSPWHSNLDQTLMAQMNIAQTEHFYLFSVLPQRDCYRALANHYVDLSSFQQIRHWPTQHDFTPSSLTERAEIVGKVVETHIKAFCQVLPTKIGLSAGYETRLMLACAKSLLPHLKFWTRVEDKYQSSVDQQIACYLADRFQLNHEVIRPNHFASAESPADVWLQNTGYCIGGSALRHRAMIDPFKGAYFALTGLGGEICRAFYRPELTREQRLTPEILARVAGVPFNDAFNTAGLQYLAGISDLPIQQQLELFYLEIRMGAYGSPHKYGNQQGIIFIYPLNHRHAVSAMFNLPTKLQYKNALHQQVIQQFWPELADIPFNEPLNPIHRHVARFWKRLKKTIRWAQGRLKKLQRPQ